MVCCWWCTETIDGEELSMPCKYNTKEKKFFTYGKYCSWSCVKAHALDRFGASRGGVVCGNIICMRKQMYNKVSPVQRAPDRFRLQKFGGDMTIEEFRANEVRDKDKKAKKVWAEHERDVRTEDPPQVASSMSTSTSQSTSKKLEEIQSANAPNQALKLKRNKPLKRSHNDLESALGLIITPKQLSH